MYHLTPETLIRIEDAADPKRGFNIPWGQARNLFRMKEEMEARSALKRGGFYHWGVYRLVHPNAITEV